MIFERLSHRPVANHYDGSLAVSVLHRAGQFARGVLDRREDIHGLLLGIARPHQIFTTRLTLFFDGYRSFLVLTNYGFRRLRQERGRLLLHGERERPLSRYEKNGDEYPARRFLKRHILLIGW